MPAQQLTAAQLEDASRLRAAFRAFQQARRSAKLPASQDALSEELGFGQSAVSQYLNGKIPLNPDALAKFSRLLGVPAVEISPDIALEQAKHSAIWLNSQVVAQQVPDTPAPRQHRAARAAPRAAQSPLGRNLAALIAHAGIDGAAWAAKHRLPPTLIALIIDGSADPNVSEVALIARRLGLQAWQLLVPELHPTDPPILQRDGEGIKALLKNINSTKEALAGFLCDGGNTDVGDLDDATP